MLTLSLYLHNNPASIATYHATSVPASGDHVVLDDQSQGYQDIAREQHLKRNFSNESSSGWDETWCLIWHNTLPDGRPSHSQCLHVYTHFSPTPGRSAHECRVIPVFEAMFTGYLIGVSEEEAQLIDPGLAASVREMCAKVKHLTRLQQAFPLTAQLCFVDVARTPEGILYDVYRKSALFETRKSLGRFHRARLPMQYLTTLLHRTGVLPTRLFEGRPRVLVPSQPGWRSDLLLAEALAARIWGAWNEVPAFQFEVMVI